MNSAYMYFTYLGVVKVSEFMSYGLYECHECYALVRDSSVENHYSSHGIA